MAKKENAASNDSNIESESPYIQEESSAQNKTNWLSSRAAKITALAVGSSLALGAAFAGGAAAGQLAGGGRGGEFGMSQSGPNQDENRRGGPDGQRPPHKDGHERGGREDHDGPKSFGPPMDMPAPSSTTAP